MDPGTQLGPYEIKEPLGEGGMGQVYRAHDGTLRRDVAVKLLPEDVADDPQRLARLKREARSLAALNHPHIAAVHGFEEQEGTSFIVMELVQGRTLAEKLEGGPLPVQEALELGVQIARALEAAHERGIVHRDLKPQNVKITPTGEAKVLDFGLAKRLERETKGADSELPTATVKTRTGAVMGTPPYMSPEQIRGEAIDQRTDIWTFGCLLYEMLRGQSPFAAETAGDTLAAVLTQEPDWDRLPLELEGVQALLEGCLRKDRGHRLQDITEVREQVEKILAVGVLAAVTWRLGGVGNDTLDTGAAAPIPEIRSLAVLPLDNLSGDPAQEYFVGGMHDALIAEIARIGDLKVISRTSAMSYEGTRKRLPEIAEELGVDALVEGAVMQAGDRVRITLELIHAPTDHHMWAQSYERELRDILRLQGEVARAIAEEIQITVDPDKAAGLAASRPVEPDAYRLWLKGNFQLTRLNEQAYRRALKSYREAASIDPTYAPAYAGISMAYAELGGWHASMAPAEVLPKAKKAAEQALALDSTVAEAHITLAHIRRLFEWDWAAAERAFNRAIELDSTATLALLTYANFLTSMGRYEESIELGKKALEIDPLSPAVYNEIAWALELSGRDGEALELCRQGLEIDPDFRQSHWLLEDIYIKRGEFEQGLALLAKAARGEDVSPRARGYDGLYYALAGRGAEAREILSRLMEGRRSGYLPASAVADIHLGLGEHEEALRWLESAYQERDMSLVWLNEAWWYDPLRSEPRFRDLLRRMGFPGVSG